jgi:hypothetical protein
MLLSISLLQSSSFQMRMDRCSNSLLKNRGNECTSPSLCSSTPSQVRSHPFTCTGPENYSDCPFDAQERLVAPARLPNFVMRWLVSSLTFIGGYGCISSICVRYREQDLQADWSAGYRDQWRSCSKAEAICRESEPNSEVPTPGMSEYLSS